MSTFYVDNAGDFLITDDQGAGGLDVGDTVTWNSPASHPAGSVAGLIFGTNAFASIQEAVNAAQANEDATDTINVAAGTFVENVSINTGVEIVGTAGTIVDGGQAGSVFVIGTGQTVILDTLTIQNGRATNGGGVRNSGQLTLKNSSIEDNVAIDDGGGIYHLDGAMAVEGGSEISGNTAGGSGGGISVAQFGTLTIDASTISDNSAMSLGGGISNFGDLLIQNGSLITRNSSNFGAGIHTSLNSATIVDSTISDNSAASSGGGITNSGQLTIQSGSVITSNTANFGGGIRNTRDTLGTENVLIIDNSVVSENTAHSTGGGIANLGQVWIRNESVITGNTASLNGGGLSDGANGSVTIEGGSVISANVAGRHGGAIESYSSGLLTIDDSTIEANTAADDGGGLYLVGSSKATRIQNGSLITRNVSGDLGGGIVSSGGQLEVLDGTSITENSAGGDGGGLFSSGTATIQGRSLISGNTASNGGGIFNRPSGTIIFEDSTILDNTAVGAGGGIANEGVLTLSGTNTTLDFNNPDTLSGSGVVTISPDGIVTFAENTLSTLTSNITLTSGTTLVNGTVDNSGGSLTVQTGAVLSGSGTVNRAITVENGGTISLEDASILNLGDTTFLAGGTFNAEINGIGTAGVDFSQLDVTGTVNITGAVLNLSGSVTGTIAGDFVVLINNDGSDLVVGEFAGLADGNLVTINGEPFQIFYHGGDGNDVILLSAAPLMNDAIYVNDSFTGGNGTIIADADLNTEGAQMAVVGITAFRTIQEGVNAVGDGGTVFVTDDLATDGPGMYVENVHIAKNITIAGTEGDPTAVIVDGNQAGSVFVIGSDATVTLDSLTIQNGLAAYGGGIHNQGDLTLSNNIVRNNVATGTSEGEGGGGIYNSGAMMIGDSILTGNSASNQGGGLFVGNGATATIVGGTISSNTANYGGGIENNGATVRLTDANLSMNPAFVDGGGLHANGSGITEITGGTINGNFAGEEGGGLWNGTGTMTIDGVTIDGNTASAEGADQGGGGFFNSGGTVQISNGTTISNNLADGSHGSGGGILNDSGVLHIDDSNLNNNSASEEGGGIWNGWGMMTIDATSIDGNTAGGVFAGQGEGGGIFNWVGTVIIQNGSQISNNIASGSFGRGGAISNGFNDFKGVFGDYSAELMITDSTVSDNRADEAGGGLYNSGAMNIYGVAIHGNIAGNPLDNGGSGLLFVGQSVIFSPSTSSSGKGGGIFNNTGGILSIHLSTIIGNRVGHSIDSDGGGIFNNAGGIATIEGSTVSRNTVSGNGGGVLNHGTFSAANSTLVLNIVQGDGGGIWSSGTLALTNSTVSSNTNGFSDGGGQGGGVYIQDGMASIRNSTITENVAHLEGGGLHNLGAGTVTLWSSIIAGNSLTGAFIPELIPSVDVEGAIDSGSSFNLIGQGSGLEGIANGVNGNLVGTPNHPLDPRLGPLADNGGPTLTHALLPESRAVNAGSNPDDLVFDQRGEGFARQFGRQTDIGAFELQVEVPLDLLVTAPGPGTVGIVQVFDAASQNLLYEFEPYPGFLGGVRVAVGDVNFDGMADIITAAGPGGGPHVKVINGADGATELYSFFAYDLAFLGGMYVASADINSDGFADIITGADSGGGPHVKVFSGANGSELLSFFAFGEGFAGGVRVAAGDISGDGTPDIIVGAGPGAGLHSPHIRIFDGSTAAQIAGPLGSFYAYDPAFTGGVFVAAGDVNGDGRIDLITGAGTGGGPHVRVFDGATGGQLAGPLGSFFAYDQDFTGGVRVAVSDINLDGMADIITGPGQGGGPHLRVFDAASAEAPVLIQNEFVEDPHFTGGLFVAGSVDLESTIAPALADENLDLIFADTDLLDGLLN